MTQTAELSTIEPNLTPNPIHPGTRIGHVHLKVADLDRALEFYCGVLGFELKQRYGRKAAFLSAGGYHHHIGLNTWDIAAGSLLVREAGGLISELEGGGDYLESGNIVAGSPKVHDPLRKLLLAHLSQ